jgi:hypothetical protein
MRHAPVRPIHDPNVNYQVIEALLKSLFGNDFRRLTEWTDKMVGKNCSRLGIVGHAFLYSGIVYRQSNVVGIIKAPKLLHGELMEEMDALLADKAIVDDHRASVRQTLVNLFDPCESLQDMRDTLPECLVGCLPRFQQISREKEPAFTIANNPRAMRQYAKVLPLMESYAAARLIF